MSARILFVDDDESILAGIQRNLRKQFSIDIAVGGEEGIKKVAEVETYAVVVADMQMPKMNGIEFLKQVETKAPDAIRVMLTGNADQRTAIDAVNEGHVFRFLTKPCTPETIAAALHASLRQHRLVIAERELLEGTLRGSIKVMTDILSMMDPHSFGRAQSLRDHIRKFAESFRLADAWELELAAMLSPIGYLAVPMSVLEKVRTERGLSGAEKEMLTRVPEIGANLLAHIPRLESVSRIILYQNKNFDGTGFPPDNVAGEQIPVGSRILKVLQDLLVIESAKVPRFRAFAKMQQCDGRYDPQVLEAVAASFDVCLTDNQTNGNQPQCIAFKELRVGHTLHSDLLTNDGNLIAPAGVQVSPMLIQKLCNFAEVSGIKEPILVA